MCFPTELEKRLGFVREVVVFAARRQHRQSLAEPVRSPEDLQVQAAEGTHAANRLKNPRVFAQAVDRIAGEFRQAVDARGEFRGEAGFRGPTLLRVLDAYEEKIGEYRVGRGIDSRACGARDELPGLPGPVLRAGPFAQTGQPPREHELPVGGRGLRFRIQPGPPQSAAVSLILHPLECPLADAHEPLARGLEALSGGGAVESEERRLVKVQTRTPLGQPRQHAIAPARQAQRVAVADASPRQSREPRSADGQVVEVVVEERQDSRQRREELGRWAGERADERGVRRNHAADARPAGFAQPALQTPFGGGEPRGAALVGQPVFEPLGRRRGRLPHRIHPADGRVLRVPSRGVDCREVGPALGSPAGPSFGRSRNNRPSSSRRRAPVVSV